MPYHRPAMRAAGCLTLGGLLLGTAACGSTEATNAAAKPPSGTPVVSTSPIAVVPAEAAAPQPMSVPATAPTTPPTKRPPIHAAPAQEFTDGKTYYAKILAVGTGSPSRLTLELMSHYMGAAANKYAAAHGLPEPMDDHLDIDRGFSAVVTISSSARFTIDPDDTGVQHLGLPAFLSWAEQHPAIEVGGGLGGPLYHVEFAGDVLTGANEIFEP